MRQTIKYTMLIAVTGLLLSSCVRDTKKIENPAVYNFERDGQSTVSFSGQTTRIGMATELINAMKDFNVSAETMLEMYANETATGGDANPFADASFNESTKSVKSKVAASEDFFTSNTSEAAVIKADIQSWIEAQVSEVFPNQMELAEPGKAGQASDGTSTRYVNAKGLEYNQAINKSLIGALMLDQIVNNYVSTAVLDAGTNIEDNDNGTVVEGKSYTYMEHKWDEAYGYLFGASTDASDPLATLGEDAFLNKYLDRVNADSDFSDIANTIWEAFKLGRAAIVAGDYTVRDEQADIIRKELSKVIAIRAVYYLQTGKSGLPASGTVFHDLSEGYGFIYSLRFTRDSNGSSYFSRSEVDGFIDQLMEGNGFWDVTAETLDSISEAIASKFEFTVAQAAN